MWPSLAAMAEEDWVTIGSKPKVARLVERYLADSGGYMLYALLSNAGVHPGAARG